MKHYEMMSILPGTLTEEELEPIVASIQQTAAEQGAQEVAFETLGKQRLAYPMKNIRYGYFYFFRFQAEPEQAHMIGQKMRLATTVLRSLVQIYNPEKHALAVERKKQYVARMNMQQTEEQRPQEEEGESEPKPAATEEEKKPETKRESVNMAEIDKKLDEILDNTTISDI